MSQFHFLRPFFLLLFIPLLIGIFWFVFRGRKFSKWDGICSKDLLPYVITKGANSSNTPYLLIWTLGSLLTIAMAGPAWEIAPQPLLKAQSGLAIVLDLSPSMNAEDIKPTRLQRAIYKLTDILNKRNEGQTALIVFTEHPYVVTPVTDDVQTIKAMLPVLDASIMPSTGHRADKAIEKAHELMLQAGITNGSILLISAELSSKEAERAIDFSIKHQIPISVLGVGTEAGAPIPKQSGGFLKDEKGTLIVSMLAREELTKLARSTGGTYVAIRSDESDVQKLTDFFSGMGGSQLREQSKLTQDKWKDAGYWFVLAALPCLAFLFRKGILNAIFVLILLFTPSLEAFAWKDMWKTSDQRAEELYHAQKYSEAREIFKNSDWKGAASYRLEDYEVAAELFQSNQTVEGFYNHGTSKAKKGDYEGALQSYAKALEIDPTHEDTLYNKKLIEEMKKDQEEENKKDQQQDKDNQEEQKDKDNQDSDSKGENNKDQKEDAGEDQESQDEKKDEQHSDKKDSSEEKSERQDPKEQQAEEDDKNDPQRQMDNRWLQKVTDDPGGLLRRKFLQQYRQQTKR
jgi:Ca-activated chloride channel family protein